MFLCETVSNKKLRHIRKFKNLTVQKGEISIMYILVRYPLCVRLATYCGYPDAERDNRIMEMNFGDWEMKSFDEISDPRLKEWYADYINVPATNGESFRHTVSTCRQFLDELKEKNYEKVAIFAHGGVLICAQLYAGAIKQEEAFSALTPMEESFS